MPSGFKFSQKQVSENKEQWQWNLTVMRFLSHMCLSPAAMAQRVQPGQGLRGKDSDGGPQRATHGRPGPQASLDHQHGCVVFHEEPPTLYIPEPPEEGVLPLPQHQVGPVHSLQPLHQIQQGSTGEREGAAGVEPSISAAVQRLSQTGEEVWTGIEAEQTMTPPPPSTSKQDLKKRRALTQSSKKGILICRDSEISELHVKKKTQKDKPEKIISLSIPSTFPWLDDALHSFSFVSFHSWVSTYLFIISSLHSNGHWIMTFHEDLLNRVLGTDLFFSKMKKMKLQKKKNRGNNLPSLIPD